MAETPNNPDEAAPLSVKLGPDTAKYLDDKTAESFKRQADLEESIWRSLPLFTGALIAAAAMISKAASSMPHFVKEPYSVIVHVGLALSMIAFGVAFWWLWQTVRPREYDFPADDAALSAFASGLAHFHADFGMADKELDAQVLSDLRSFQTETVAKAAKSAFNHNQARLSARSQVLVWLLWGFVLSFMVEATIFGHDVVYGGQEGSEQTHGVQAPSVHSSPSNAGPAAPSRAPLAAPNAGHQGRGVADKDQHRRADTGQEK